MLSIPLLALALSLQAANPAQTPAQTQTPLIAPAPATAASVPAPENPAVTTLARTIYAQMRLGKVDPALLTDQMNKALTPEAIARQKPVFDQLGDPAQLVFLSGSKIPQGTFYRYRATFPEAALEVQIFIDNNGKAGGYFLKPL